MKLVLCFFFSHCFFEIYGQYKPFVPLDYEYPEAILATAKKYVYKNMAIAELSFRDVTLTKRQNSVIVTWKDYGDSPLIDSNIEINDKGIEHYMILNGEVIKSTVTEDSLYVDGSRLGEKRQSEYFEINPSLTISAPITSRFLKDTTINWQGKTVPCLVIRSVAKIRISNANNVTQDQNETSNNLFYFGKNIGLMRYSSERNKELSIWELQEINEIK